MLEVEVLADCLRIVVDETISALPEGSRDGTRRAMALFVRSDLGQADPTVLAIIARVFSIPVDAI
jgi:hypothetical protein